LVATLATVVASCTDPSAPAEEFPVAYSEGECWMNLTWSWMQNNTTANDCPAPTSGERNAIRQDMDYQYGMQLWWNVGGVAASVCADAYSGAISFINSFEFYTKGLRTGWGSNNHALGGMSAPSTAIDANYDTGEAAFHESIHIMSGFQATEPEIGTWVLWCESPETLPPPPPPTWYNG
jgi:hypothetical protein